MTRFAACLLALALSQLAFAEGFKLVSINSRLEPELAEKPGVVLPGTSITAGSYTYVTANGQDVGRLGFLVRSDRLLYVDSNEYALGGDTHYGVHGNYFVMDAWGYGSTSGHNRLMFLCRFDKTGEVKLLDVIGKAYLESYGMDFMSQVVTASSSGVTATTTKPYWIDINDHDNNGEPEIIVRIASINFFLYVEIANERMRINLNPALYEPLFNEEEKKRRSAEMTSDAYYVYGFLAKKIDLKQINLALNQNKERSNRIIALLGNVGKWDAAFHDFGGEEFMMKKYDFKRQ